MLTKSNGRLETHTTVRTFRAARMTPTVTPQTHRSRKSVAAHVANVRTVGDTFTRRNNSIDFLVFECVVTELHHYAVAQAHDCCVKFRRIQGTGHFILSKISAFRSIVGGRGLNRAAGMTLEYIITKKFWYNMMHTRNSSVIKQASVQLGRNIAKRPAPTNPLHKSDEAASVHLPHAMVIASRAIQCKTAEYFE
jgi:hypothetical protein